VVKANNLSWIQFISKKKSVFATKSFSAVISKVAAAAVAISVTVMLLSISVLKGYKGLIKDKMAGFSGHIQVLSSKTAKNYEYEPFLIAKEKIDQIKSNEQVKSVYPIAQKAGIAKTKTDLEGVIIKGLFPEKDSQFYAQTLKYGRLPIPQRNGRSNEIIISSTIARRLKCDTGDVLKIYFFKENQTRGFAPKIVGIYSTGVEEYDKIFALCTYADLASHAIPKEMYKATKSSNKLAVTQLEVKVNDFAQLKEINKEINEELGYDLRSESIRDLQSQVFDWLGYLDKNIQIILLLMGIVAAINMITSILILIVDNTNLIGLLKSTGAKNREVRTLFLKLALNVVFVGLLIGNALSVLLIVLQKTTKVFRLNEANYYTDYVPVSFSLFDFLWVNILTIAICLLAMLIPSRYISKISPVRALTFK